MLAFGIFGVAFIALSLLFSSCSSMRSEASIRASLLKQKPLGSSLSDVHAFVEKRRWIDRSYIGTTGFYEQEPGEPAHTVGVSSICGQLGYYYLPFRTDVTAFWGFDASGRLIDVWVWNGNGACQIRELAKCISLHQTGRPWGVGVR
jgi:hypothetical protein